MAIWLLISAAYPVFLVVMLIKAFRHFRRLRAPVPDRLPSPPYENIVRERKPASPSDDWVPAR